MKRNKPPFAPVANALGDAIVKITSQKEEIQSLQERLDHNQTILWDVDERNKKFEVEIESLNAQLTGAHARNVTYNENYNKESRQWVDKFNKLEADLKIANQTTQMRNNEIYHLRNGKVADEHLARKLLELVADKNSLSAELDCLSTENSGLKQEIAKLKEDDVILLPRILSSQKPQCDIIAKNTEFAKTSDEVIKLREENNKYKEQTTRLIEESQKYTCIGSRSIADDMPVCGECLSCKLARTQKILEQTSANYTKSNKERNDLQTNYERRIKTITESNKLTIALETEIKHRKEMIRMYAQAISTIEDLSSFGKRRKIAYKTILDIIDYKRANSII